LRRHEDLDASWHARLSADEVFTFEGEYHLVDGGRADAEAVLDVGFGRGLQVDAGVGVDEG